MSRLDVRALAVLVVLVACSMGAPRERSTPEPAAPGADRVLLALAPTGDITSSAYAPSAPGWLWAPNLAGAGGTYLVAWIVFDGLQTNIMGARVTADGVLLDPSGILISSAPGDQKATAVAGGDAGWLVAWVDQRSGLFPTGTTAGNGDIYAARVALDGTVLDPGGIPVATGTTPRTDAGVAFTGTGWLVTWRETPSSVSGALLSAAGNVGPAFPVAASTVVSSTATVGFTDLSCGGTTCLLAFTYFDFTVGARDVLAVRIDAALGAAIDLVPFAISAASGWQDAPKVSFDGRDFLVVFEDNRAGTGYGVYATRVSTAGVALPPDGFPVSSTSSTIPGRPNVAFDGRNFVVGWRATSSATANADLWVRTVAPDGTLLGVQTLVVGGVPGVGAPRVGSVGGGRALVTYAEAAGSTGTLHGTLVQDGDARPALGLQAILGPVAQVDLPGGTGSFQRSGFASSGDGHGHLALWQQRDPVSLNLSDVYAARVGEDGTVLDPGGFVVSAAAGRQAFPAAAWTGTHWAAVWQDYRAGYTGEIYGARISPDGVVLEPNGVLVAGGDGLTRGTPEIAFDGAHLVALWVENLYGPAGTTGSIRGVLLDPTTLLPASPVFTVGTLPSLYAYGFPRASCGVGTCLVTWSASLAQNAPGEMYGARVDALGNVLDPTPIMLCIAPGNERANSVAWDGLGWIVTWNDGRSLAGYDTYATRVTPEGFVADADGFPLAEPRNPGTTPGGDWFDGARHLFAWRDDARGMQYFMRAMDPAGTLYDPEIQVTEAPAEVNSARIGPSQPGRAVIEFTYADPAAPTVSHLYVRSLVLRPPAYPLTVTRGGNGAGTVTSSPAGIDCGAACAADFPAGSSVTLTARAASGSVFSGWTGACAGTASTCTVAMNDARSVGASFSSLTYLLTVRTSGSGRGTVTGDGISCTTGSTAGCTASYASGTPVTLTATPDGSSIFTSWSGCTSASGNVCNVTMSGARYVTATFQPANWTLTVRTSGTGLGTVTGPGISCSSGSTVGCTASVQNTTPATSVTLTAEPASTSIFTSWTGCTSVSGNACTVSMTGARTVTATFQPAYWTLTVRASGTGAGTVTDTPGGLGISCTTGSTSGCTASIANTTPATNVTLTASPATDSIFASWSGCTSVSGNVCAVSMTGARSVTATFQPASWTLTVRTSGTGVGTVSGPGITCTTGSTAGCTGSVPNTTPATSVTLTATPDANSVFSSWSGCTTTSGNACTVSMTAAKTVTATFQPASWVLTVRTSGTGSGTVTGSGISCTTGSTAGCTAGVPNTTPPTSVTLTATPDVTSVFSSWTGCTSVSGNVCTVSMTAAKTAIATFQPGSWVLTASTFGSGVGTITGAGISCTTGSTANCTASVPNTTPATSVTLTATPDANSLFTSWTGCTLVSGNVCTVSMTGSKSVTATFQPAFWPLALRTAGSGTGTLGGTVNGTPIACMIVSGGCSANIPNTNPATVVTITATPDKDSVFSSWTGCTTVSGNVCTVSMTGAKTVTATFQPAYWSLTVRTLGTGAGTVAGAGISCTTGSTAGCTASVANTTPATSVTLTAAPDASSVFAYWTGCTTVSGSQCTVSMTGAKTVFATFQPAFWPLTVRTAGTGAGTVTDGGGLGISCTTGSTVACTASVANTTPATNVTLTASPGTGSIFTSWIGCTSVSGNVCTVSMTAAKTVTATFQPAYWPLTVNASGTGVGTVSGPGITCTSGSTLGCTASVANTTPATVVTLTATPNAPSTFTSWIGCTSVSGNVCTVSMTGARTVTASFSGTSVRLTVSLTGTGTGTVTGPGISCSTGSTVGCSTLVNLTIPPTGVTLTATNAVEMYGAWSGCTSVSGETCVVSMDAAKTVTKEFIGMPGPP